eukprot:scaffold6591_cov328-Ochromonas_danica.AAC.9
MNNILSSNILHVEERQDEMFDTVEQYTRNKDNLKALSEETTNNVSRTLAESRYTINPGQSSVDIGQAGASVESDLN